MANHLVTFSDESMSRAAQLCIDSAEANGIDSHARYHPGNIMHCDNMREYWSAMDRMFNHARGCGFWSWKPLIIKTDMELMNDGDILIYADAGVEFINNVSHIIDRMDQDIFLFGNNWDHAHWCKRDIVEAAWPTFADDLHREPWEYVANSATWARFGKQCQASVIFFRVSDYSKQFVAEWLKWCLFEDGRLIDDSPSRFNNHPEFQENRHDQAILTTLAYREGLKLHYWPAVYNRGGSPEFVYEKLPEYAGDRYPCLFSHHRKRDHEWADQGIMVHV
jgi:hypothetical protein